jgi:hypothetical protein
MKHFESVVDTRGKVVTKGLPSDILPVSFDVWNLEPPRKTNLVVVIGGRSVYEGNVAHARGLFELP